MKRYFIPILAGLLVSGFVFAASYLVIDDKVDDTKKVVEKTENVEVVINISVETEINAMNNDKADIESILGRFNAHKDKFNEASSNDVGSKLNQLNNATCSFPTIPEIYVELELEAIEL